MHAVNICQGGYKRITILKREQNLCKTVQIVSVLEVTLSTSASRSDSSSCQDNISSIRKDFQNHSNNLFTTINTHRIHFLTSTQTNMKEIGLPYKLNGNISSYD